MRKSTLFISALLTVFLMATIFSVASAYQQVVKANIALAEQPSQKALSQPVSADFAPMPTATEIVAPLVFTPEQATTVAVDFLGDSNVYSVEVVDYEGAATYLVTFSSGDLVYVSSTGMVVANTKIQPVVVAASSGGNGSGGQATNNNGGSSGGDDHDDDEHEDGDDD
ncbi:MAG: hypothetical protein J0L96_07620 [Anaerolineae bacterium]|nr:hypothetical protein [Anaerolineae bacterium]